MRALRRYGLFLVALLGCSSESSRRNGEVQLPTGASAPIASATGTTSRTPKLTSLSRTEGAAFTSLEETGWVATSPKGERYATGGGPSRAIMLWDASGRSLGVLEGTDVLAAAFSPDGKRLAAILPREGLALFDVETRARLRLEPRQGNTVFDLAFSPDGLHIATADGDGVVELWSADGKFPRKKLAQYKASSSLAFSPSGRSLMVAADGDSLDLWDVTSAKKTKSVLQKSTVRHVAFGAQDTTIVTAELDGKEQVVRIRDASTGAVKQTMRGHTSTINAIAFSRDARTVASGSGDGTVQVWDATTGSSLRRLSTEGQAVWSLGFSASGDRLVATGQGNTLHVWDAATGARVRSAHQHASAVSSLAYSPDGKLLVSGDASGQIFMRRAFSGAAETDPPRALKAGPFIHSMGFSSDGTRLHTVSKSGLEWWDASSLTSVRTIALGRFSAVVFSPNEKEFTVGDESRIVTLRRAHDGSLLRSFGQAQPHDDRRQNLMTPSSVAFSPDGTLIAIARWDQPVELWDRENGARVRSLEGTLAVAFSPDGERIATGDGTVSKRAGPLSLKIVNVATGAVEHTLDGEPEAAFSRDGRFVLGSRGGELRVWNVSTGKLETSTPAHRMLSFAISRDGTRVATGALDGAVTEWKLWED